MSKETLVDQTISVLTSAGFTVSDRCNIRPCSFDIIARREEILILFKVLFNIDGLTEETATEMKVLASHLNSSILIIGSNTRGQKLENDVVYMRYNIVSINLGTLYDYFVDNIPILISASPGGLYVPIDGLILKKARTEVNMSLGSLASIIGVSRRTISKYEEEGMNASIDIVLSLEEALDIELAKPINLLKIYSTKNENFNKLNNNIKNNKTTNKDELMLDSISSLGFDVKKAYLAPFQAILKEKNMIILTGISSFTKTTIKRAELMSNISEIANTESIFLISGYSKVKSIQKTVFFEKKDLDKISGPEELFDLIEKRKI